MILLHKPSDQIIKDYLASIKDKPFTYNTLEMTRDTPVAPPGFVLDHCRGRLGEGEATYQLSVKYLKHWQHFNLGWLDVCNREAPIEAGGLAGLLCSYASVWLLFACRIVYVVNEEKPVIKYGFAYGTLPGHPETGEERFLIEWHHADNSVWYDILAISRPGNFAVTLAYPLTRALQKKFARDSQLSMLRAARGQEDSATRNQHI